MTRPARAVVGLVLAVAGVLALGGCSSDPVRSTGPTTLPHVTLASFNGGSPLDLRSLKGPAVLNVWASWCGPCRAELPRYQAFSQQYAGKVKVLGIDFQDTRSDLARQLIARTGVRYPLYTDPDGSVRARVLPQLILVDAHGRIAYQKAVEITSVAQLEQLVSAHLDVTGRAAS